MGFSFTIEQIKENIRKINGGELTLKSDYEDYENLDLSNTQQLRVDKFLNANQYKNQYYLVMQFQGVRIGKYEYELVRYIKQKGIFNVNELYEHFSELDSKTVMKFIKLLIFEEAVHIVGESND